MGGLFREIVGPYIFIVAAFLLYLLYSMSSGWRAFLGWVIFLSVQLPIDSDTIRPAVSDAFIPFMLIAWALASAKPTDSSPAESGADARSRILPWVILFVAMFFVFGNTIAFINLGYLPSWTLINKDVGLITLLIVFSLSIYYVRNLDRLLELVRWFVYTGCAINIIAFAGGIFRYVFGISNNMMRDNSSLRLVGFNINPGSYGGWLLVITLIQFSLLISRSSIIGMRRSLQWINVIIGSVNIIMTLSRSSYMGVIAGFLTAIVLSKRGSIKSFLIISLLALLSIANIFKHSENSDLDQQFRNGVYRSDTVQQRTDINMSALNLLIESPANIPFGIGIGTFLIRSEELLGHQIQIHNTFLWILVEMGCVGFIVMLAMFYCAFMDCRFAARTDWIGQPIAIGVMSCIMATFAWFMGDEGLWHRHVWFILILADSVYRIYLQEMQLRQSVEIPEGHTEFLHGPTFVTH
jgi:O-antigen ligase